MAIVSLCLLSSISTIDKGVLCIDKIGAIGGWLGHWPHWRWPERSSLKLISIRVKDIVATKP